MRKALPLIVLAAALLASGCPHRSDLPKLFPVPEATLTRSDGKPLRLAENKGYVTVYDFIFTNCAGTCPLMSMTMRNITKRVPKDAPVRFVSISVDPDRDTPEKLATYAKRVGNDDRWLFVRGDRQTVVDISVQGFKLAAGDPQPGGEALLHSSKFAIADKNGMIREYYGGTEPDAAEHVAATVQDLARE